MIARQTAVQTAISFKGKRNEIVDIYNTYMPRPRGYKVKYDDMLCATYISAVYVKLGWTDIVPPECGAWRLYANMEALGRAVLDKKRVPEVGDLIFFGNGTTVKKIQHVGIVTEVQNGKQIYYYDIQANVGRHTCPVGYSYVMGYGMPDYAAHDLDKPEPTPEPAPQPVPQPDHVYAVGDLVTINPGARWYRGQSIKLSCINDKWYIMSIKGDRAVLGMNLAETRNIQSPIHTCDISLVVANGAIEQPPEDKVSITVTVDKETLELLDIMATGNHKTMGEVIDMLLEDAR